MNIHSFKKLHNNTTNTNDILEGSVNIANINDPTFNIASGDGSVNTTYINDPTFNTFNISRLFNEILNGMINDTNKSKSKIICRFNLKLSNLILPFKY